MIEEPSDPAAGESPEKAPRSGRLSAFAGLSLRRVSDRLSPDRLVGFLAENRKPVLYLLIAFAVVLCLIVFGNALLAGIGAVFGAVLIFIAYAVAAMFSIYVLVALVTVALSLPFVLVLIFIGALRHPKELNTLRMGRSLLATGFIVALGGIYAETLEAAFAYGAINLPQETIRGYSWMAVALLAVGYARALYGEGLTSYTAPKEQTKSSKWGLLLRPVFVLNAVFFELLIPAFVTLSILIGFGCDGFGLAVAIFDWMVSQFSFLAPITAYLAELLAQLLQVDQIIVARGWWKETWTGIVEFTASTAFAEFLQAEFGSIHALFTQSRLFDVLDRTFNLPECR